MTAAFFCVIVAVFFGVYNFRKYYKAIERRFDREFLNDARQDVSVFEEYSEENRKQTAKKLKKLKKLKGEYND